MDLCLAKNSVYQLSYATAFYFNISFLRTEALEGVIASPNLHSGFEGGRGRKSEMVSCLPLPRIPHCLAHGEGCFLQAGLLLPSLPTLCTMAAMFSAPGMGLSHGSSFSINFGRKMSGRGSERSSGTLSRVPCLPSLPLPSPTLPHPKHGFEATDPKREKVVLESQRH